MGEKVCAVAVCTIYCFNVHNNKSLGLITAGCSMRKFHVVKIKLRSLRAPGWMRWEPFRDKFIYARVEYRNAVWSIWSVWLGMWAFFQEDVGWESHETCYWLRMEEHWSQKCDSQEFLMQTPLLIWSNSLWFDDAIKKHCLSFNESKFD